MGMIDNYTKLASEQAVTSTGDTASTNVYDAGSVHTADIGAADEVWVNAVVGATAVTSAGSATVQAVLQDSADNSSWADVLAGPVVPKASCVAGAVLLQSCLPVGLRRYTRLVWRVGTAALTAGTFTGYYSLDIQRNIARPSGFTVA